jgi:hypothetical protein
VATIRTLCAFCILTTSMSIAKGARASSTTTRKPFPSDIRGMTIGPIENAYHPGKGYGSAAFGRSLLEAKAMGANWISITPFGRVGSLAGLGVDLRFEAPFEENRANVLRAIQAAHALGLSVMLVPHLWVESGEWRALIDPRTDAGWSAWVKSYGAFVMAWAKVAAEGNAEMLSIGVELRSWVTSTRAPLLLPIVAAVRAVYPGWLTYSANWDDAANTVIWGSVDAIGINAFYPLAMKEGDGIKELLSGGERVRTNVEDLQSAWQKPVFFTEMGYTTRADPALKPWEWPDGMKNVRIDEHAQADAYLGLLFPFLSSRSASGFFVWRSYSDPDDVSQEAEWGFSPRGKRAECILRSAFAFRGVPGFSTRFCIPGLYP